MKKINSSEVKQNQKTIKGIVVCMKDRPNRIWKNKIYRKSSNAEKVINNYFLNIPLSKYWEVREAEVIIK